MNSRVPSDEASPLALGRGANREDVNHSGKAAPVEALRRHRIVLTGLTGNLGRHVLEQIAAFSEARVLALLRSTSQPGLVPDWVQCERVDFQNQRVLAELLKAFQPTAVVHCAAEGMQMQRSPWSERVDFNVGTTVRLCEVAARIPHCHFLYVSSGLAYRGLGRMLRESDPLDSCHPYASTKAAADLLVRAAAAELRMPLTVVRPFAFSGVGDSGTRLFPSLLHAAEQKRPLDLSSGNQIRDYSAVTDIAEGIALALARPLGPTAKTEIFNLGSGHPCSLRELVGSVVAQLGLEVRLNFGARDYAPFEPEYLVGDPSHARKVLQWQPRTNFAFAIWQLARESFPSLKVTQPQKSL
jgi:nucleoside-diphosphate-sugar epimerase